VADKKKLPKRGSLLRPHLDKEDEFREVIASGGNSAATATADAASSTLTFSNIQEEGIVDYFILQAGAAIALVAGSNAGLVGTVVTSAKIGGNELIGGGNVPAQLFAWDSQYNPRVGIPVDSTRTLTVTITNNSGAGIESTAGVTLS
jgi:hypothetical protein